MIFLWRQKESYSVAQAGAYVAQARFSLTVILLRCEPQCRAASGASACVLGTTEQRSKCGLIEVSRCVTPLPAVQSPESATDELLLDRCVLHQRSTVVSSRAGGLGSVLLSCCFRQSVSAPHLLSFLCFLFINPSLFIGRLGPLGQFYFCTMYTDIVSYDCYIILSHIYEKNIDYKFITISILFV